ncbi:MAG: DNA translocase FtsK, partial [Gemmatimonadota bacterium]
PDASELPPLELLSPAPEQEFSVSEEKLDALGKVLVDKLRTFRVEGRIGGRTTGPVVTQFEVVPASGVKVGRIAALADDLALALKAPSVRIIAPIPGKGAVGVEVPNPERKTVYLRELLESSAYRNNRAELPLALGEDVTGQPYVSDLTSMPHLLIAGVTGSGKSVCINAIITSLIYRYTPDRLRLLLVDPKMVELAGYNVLPHLRHTVVTDNSDAASVLKWLVYEMERRYAWLGANGCRNVAEFNRRVTKGATVRPPGSDLLEAIEEPEPLPYIVLIIDELADLMMTVQAEVERPLAFLAQKARATGIHLVVATQRPSVNVITGLIKANFSCRIAFRVASKVDSRTIIDQNGADTLLGNGDMLFLPPGESEPVRIQGTFVSTEDTERLMEWYRIAAEQPVPTGEEEDILESVRGRELEEADRSTVREVLEESDPLFRQAAELVIQNQQGSTSLLQRRLKIGYGRAARIVDQLHAAGIVGPPEGSKPREILVTLEDVDRICADR